MKSFSSFIRVNDSIEVGNSRYSQNEIEKILIKMEMDAQYALLNDATPKKEKGIAVEIIRFIRTVRPKFDNDGNLSSDTMKKLIQLKKSL